MNPYSKASKHTQKYQKSAANVIDKGRMIILLYKAAIRHLNIASEKIQQQKIEDTHNSLAKVKSIISELQASLNMEAGGSVSEGLQKIYTYVYDRLIDANLHKDQACIDEVINILTTLLQGWETIIDKKGQPGTPQQRLQTKIKVSI